MTPQPTSESDLLKRPLYVYDLPQTLLDTLRPKSDTAILPTELESQPASTGSTLQSTPSPPSKDAAKPSAGGVSCALCSATFSTPLDQRAHVKTDWHAYNLKQRMRAAPTVDESQFEQLVGELDESISGSDDSSSSESDEERNGNSGEGSRLASLLKKQARMHDVPAGIDEDDDAFFGGRKRKRGGGKPPILWFESDLVAKNTSLGVYRALLTPAEQEAASADPVGLLRRKQLKPAEKARAPPKDDGNGVPLPVAKAQGPSVFICMIGGGHFAAMIVSLTPETAKNHAGSQERRVNTIAQKTFHRYTTRRKQGGAQSSNDAAKGNAHSAGAGIRRANEAALQLDVRNLLWEWRGLIADCDLLFIRANGTTNRRLLFDKHERQVLKTDDERIRSIPFSTRRATQQECMRAFVELTRVKVSQVDEAALAAAQAERDREEQRAKNKAAAASTPQAQEVPALSPEEEEALLHTGQLQALIRRSKVPGLLSYLSKNNIPASFRFQPESNQANHHASTPLHLAASLNSPIMVNALLIKAEADPSIPNGEGKPAFDIAGDRATRDSFRVARTELGETRWDWSKAHVPSALTKAEAEQRDKEEKALGAKGEAERRKAELEKLERERASAKDMKQPVGKRLKDFKMTAEDKREAEARSMTPEMRMKVERERRARAAEERMKRLAGN